MNDPWANTALRKAEQPEPVNDGHRYEVKVGDVSYYADVIRLDELTGYPEWWADRKVCQIHGRRLENSVVVDFKPMSRADFERRGVALP